MSKIIGLSNGIVLQRDKRIKRCDSDSYFYLIGAEGKSVSIDPGSLEELGSVGNRRKFHLTGIPAGGPFTVTLTIGDEINVFTDVYVGDVWIIGGQSNMEGYGYLNQVLDAYVESPMIRNYSTEGVWTSASPTLHQNQRSNDKIIKDCFPEDYYVWKHRGVGPGYYFAKEMYERTAAPQGIISCALGGSSLGKWDPDAPKEPNPNLYGVMMRKFEECGSNVRGFFWHQGCSETSLDRYEKFSDKMVHFIESFRRDFGIPDLPFVQGQLFMHISSEVEIDHCWNHIREVQRTLHEKIPHMDTVATTDAELADGIHLSAKYQKKLGKNAAESMYHLCFDPCGITSTLAPQFDTVYRVTAVNDFGQCLAVKYKNLNGKLVSEGRPNGFALSTSPETVDRRHIFRIDLHNDTVYIRYEQIEDDELENMYLFYFFGNKTYANITDESGRPIPAMGPIPLRNYITK